VSRFNLRPIKTNSNRRRRLAGEPAALFLPAMPAAFARFEGFGPVSPVNGFPAGNYKAYIPYDVVDTITTVTPDATNQASVGSSLGGAPPAFAIAIK
jgi:hypothetical protein